MHFKSIMAIMLGMLALFACKKDEKPNTETFKINKEKETVMAEADHVTISGVYDYSGVINSMTLRVGKEEHLFGSTDYPVALNGHDYLVEITGLQPATLYYYGYVVDYGAATDWSSEVYTFTTAEDLRLPTVATVEVVGVNTTSATCLCNVVEDGGAEVTERGACWSTRPNPDISGMSYANGNGLGEYSIDITELEPNTTYYVKAYAKNSKGIGYGEELTFTTIETMEVPDGCLNGLYSVADDKQVWFSQGNLRYLASTNQWGFAEQQNSYEGQANANISETNDGWIDLFAWGTSGFDHGAVCYQPWSILVDDSSYYAYGSASSNLFDQTGQADWGYNIISDIGNQEGLWRTLTVEEWEYVFDLRATASGIRFVKAQVGGVNGVILLPDEWNTSFYTLNNINQKTASFTSNVISLVNFESELHYNGAVFLPAAGRRKENVVDLEGTSGMYWSSTAWGVRTAFVVTMDSDLVEIYTTYRRYYGLSVRLVQDAI
jgi:hypothetical protein